MSKFNSARTVRVVNNLAGGSAFDYSKPEFVLYNLCATNFITDNFYRSSSDSIQKIREAISNCSYEYVAKLAIYCRETLNLRTVSLVLLVELARVARGDNLVSRAVCRTINRADELTEILAYYMHANGHRNLKKLSKQISKGVADAFHKFDEYQFSKYKASGKEVSLRDAMFITHPKPTSTGQAALFSRIANDNLAIANTWETAKTTMGQKMADATDAEKQAASKATWEAQILGRKMGYMAILRNLRNILQDDVSLEAIKAVCDYLTNDTAVANSKQIPFRFYTAYREISGLGQSVDINKARMVVNAIKIAGYKSLSNMEIFDENDKVLAVSDVSGSMSSNLSSMGTVSRAEVALFYTGMFAHLNNATTGYFGERFGFDSRVEEIDPFVNAVSLQSYSRKYGHATNAHLVFEHLIKNKISMDKIIIFTDEQFWDKKQHWGRSGIVNGNPFNDALARYRKEVNPDTKLFMIDLAGYATGSPMKLDGNTIKIAGFSNDTFKMLGNLEHSYEIIKEIQNIRL